MAKWTDITAKQTIRDLDTYFAMVIKAEEVFQTLMEKYPGKYAMMWNISHLDGSDILLEWTSDCDGAVGTSKAYFDEKTGELVKMLNKLVMREEG